jgi:hypothetical protein
VLHATSQTRKKEGGVSLLSRPPGNPDIIAINTNLESSRSPLPRV